MNDYFLLFSGHYDRDPVLDWYRLRLCSLSLGKIDIWVATTSIAAKQGVEGFHQKGGLIPPEYRVPGLLHWQVDTVPINLSHVRGVEGDFFRIHPYQVTTDKGGVRGDFGIHLDANAPGSLGCPVMNGERFASFKREMAKLEKKGIRRIPLFVTYS